MSCREALGGDIGWDPSPGKAAPLLARFLRELGDEVLASVDCDQRFKLPRPSTVGLSPSIALLLLLLLCEVAPPARRKAIRDVSPGLCEPIGSTELRALLEGELSEPVRLTVFAEELDLGRVDARWCLETVELPGPSTAETEALLPCIMASALETECRRTAVEDHAPVLQPYNSHLGCT